MAEVKTETPTEEQSINVQRSSQRLFHLSLPDYERRLLLIGLDLLAVNGALLLALALRSEHSLTWRLVIEHPLWFLLLSALWFPLAYALDAYNLRVTGRFSTSAPVVLKAGAITVGIYLLIPYLTPPLPASRLSLFAFFLLTFLLLLAGRGLYILTLAQPFFYRRALIVGAGWAGRTIAQALLEQGDGTYQVIGFIDDDPTKLGERVLDLPILGTVQDLSRLVEASGVSELILAITHELRPEPFQALLTCQEQGVQVTPMPVLYEALLGQVPVEHVGQNWYIALPLDHPQIRFGPSLLKRVVDLLVAIGGLVLFAPLLPVLALAIKLDSPGPVFYWQARVGKQGRVFRLVKLRTMVQNAEPDGRAVWAEERDPRTTRVGRLLRLTMLDEIPQLWNVLKGEMSFVGPRPERPELVAELEQKIPFYRLRHAVKPGMAGWALLHQGYARSVEESLIKLQYDLYYIKHQSLWFDLVIVLRTIGQALSLRRVERTRHQT